MKNLWYSLLMIAIVLAFASCGSLPSPSVSGVLGAVAGGASSGGAVAAASASVEFQSGEVLTSSDTGPMTDCTYYVGKILTPASPATKNQAESILITDGKKYWVNYVLNSRKATKADFTVGATVFVLRGRQEQADISADNYRKSGWVLGNVTSVEELFKNNVEVDGQQYTINFVRIPTDPIK